MTYADHLQIQAMEERAKESQAKDAMVRDKSTGEACVSPKPVAQKIQREDLHALIGRVEYQRLEGTTKTLCHIFIGNNGFSVTGESGRLNPADFKEDVGREYAFENGFDKLWELEGYHRMRVAVDQSGWPDTHTDDSCTVADADKIIDQHMALSQDQKKELGRFYVDSISAGFMDRAAGECVAASVTVQPHQQRVIDEKAALDKNAKALSDFIGLNPVFDALDPAEQERMKVQNDLMWQLSEVLGQRINAFGGSATPEFRTSTRDSGV